MTQEQGWLDPTKLWPGTTYPDQLQHLPHLAGLRKQHLILEFKLRRQNSLKPWPRLNGQLVSTVIYVRVPSKLSS